MDTATTYNKIIDLVWERYAPRVDAKLAEIEQVILNELGWQFSSGIFDMSDDEYSHRFFAAPYDTDEGREQGVEVSLILGEARQFGDDDEYPSGVSFRLDIIGMGGRIVGQYAPFNYTPEVWVDATDANAVEDRWQLMEQADTDDVPTLIQNYLARDFG